jgi:citrate synthase
MTDGVEVHHGLEGVVAFESEIAEPDKEGSALRYRGVDIDDLVGRVPFEKIWGLLVDGTYDPGLPPAEPFPIPVHSVTSAPTCRAPSRSRLPRGA